MIGMLSSQERGQRIQDGDGDDDADSFKTA